MEEKFNFEGIFRYDVFDKNNNKIAEYEDKNRIVDNSFDIITGLLVNGDGNFKINTLKLGNGGVLNNILQTVQKTDQSLYNIIYSSSTPQIIISSINDTYIKFIWTFDYADANGTGVNVFNEAGLFSDSLTDKMFSRKTFPSIIKDSSKKILVTWILRYAYS